MTYMLDTSRRTRLAVVLALALAASGVWTAAFQRAGYTQAHFTGNSLMVDNRSALSICVDSKVSDIGNEQLAGAAARALEHVKKHPHYQLAGLAAVNSTVEVGCPGPARAGLPGFDPTSGELGDDPAQSIAVAQPSRYRTFVFIVPEERISTFKELDPYTPYPVRRTPQETYCHDGECFEVTTALYFTRAELGNASVLVPNLIRGVGLDPRWEDEYR